MTKVIVSWRNDLHVLKISGFVGTLFKENYDIA